MNYDFLKNNANFANISPEKIDFLMKFAAQNKSGNAKEMSNMVMGAVNTAKQEGIQFTPNETDLIIEILKQKYDSRGTKESGSAFDADAEF